MSLLQGQGVARDAGNARNLLLRLAGQLFPFVVRGRFNLARHGGRKRAGGPEKLRPPQRFSELSIQFFDSLFRTLAFCHVANGASDVKSLGCPQWAQTDLSRKLSLIFASSVKVQVAPHRTHALLGKERCAILQVRAAESGWNQNLDSLPDQFLTTVPE